LRIIANGFGLHLSFLEVEVQGFVDVRGTLMIDKEVRVGFQRFDVHVNLEATQALSAEHKKMLIDAAEKSCIVMQTLKSGSKIDVSFI
jgi:uncharacterized OsmC-like protein